tara:strand:- start:483 stop:917 length:435 start_codon:yes stop_codon:yes gene_type:complete
MRFSKEVLNFLKEIGGPVKKRMTPITPSASTMGAGDVLLFNYKHRGEVGKLEADRLFLVLTIRRAKTTGIFTSTKANILVFGMNLNSNSAAVGIVLENLYMKRRRPSYYGLIKEALIALLGKNSFRTYNIQSMGITIRKVDIRG